MRNMIAVICVIAATCAAHGETASTRCTRTAGSLSCDTTWFDVPERGAKIINIKHPVQDPQRYERWWKFCDPRIRTDELGVEHYVYAHKGCEFGRDH